MKEKRRIGFEAMVERRTKVSLRKAERKKSSPKTKKTMDNERGGVLLERVECSGFCTDCLRRTLTRKCQTL